MDSSYSQQRNMHVFLATNRFNRPVVITGLLNRLVAQKTCIFPVDHLVKNFNRPVKFENNRPVKFSRKNTAREILVILPLRKNRGKPG